MERSVERRYERRDFVGKMLGTGQGGFLNVVGRP